MIYQGDRYFGTSDIHFDKRDTFRKWGGRIDMDVKEKLRKLSFVKNQMMKEGPENINDVEPTICPNI